MRYCANDFTADAITEVIFVAISTHVHEGQHGNGGLYMGRSGKNDGYGLKMFQSESRAILLIFQLGMSAMSEANRHVRDPQPGCFRGGVPAGSVKAGRLACLIHINNHAIKPMVNGFIYLCLNGIGLGRYPRPEDGPQHEKHGGHGSDEEDYSEY